MYQPLEVVLLGSLFHATPSVESLLQGLGQRSTTERMMARLALERAWGRMGDPADELAVYLALSEGVFSSGGSRRVRGEEVSMTPWEQLVAEVSAVDRRDYLGREALADPRSGRITARTLGYSESLPTGTTPRRGDLVFVLRPGESEPSGLLVALGGGEAIAIASDIERVRLSTLAAAGQVLRYGPILWRGRR